jgi:hypothetical protein
MVGSATPVIQTIYRKSRVICRSKKLIGGLSSESGLACSALDDPAAGVGGATTGGGAGESLWGQAADGA